MAVDTKPNLSCEKFEQWSGDTLYLSGGTMVCGSSGVIKIGDDASFCLSENAALGRVMTSDAYGKGTWQDTTSSASGDALVKEITQSSHGFVVGDVIGFSGGTYNKAIANGTYDGEVIGIISCCVNANTFKVTQAGYVTGLTGLVTGCTYFLSTLTAGAITYTEPTGDTMISKTVLVATSDSTGFVLPYPGYVVSTGSTSGIISSSNGLTDDGTTVCLGGTLVGDTVIDLNNFKLCTGGYGNIQLSASTTAHLGAQGTNQNYIFINSGGFGAGMYFCSDTSGGGGFDVGMTLANRTNGLIYNACYSTGFTNSLSIVDKGYVDNAISAATSGITDSITGATNGLSVIDKNVVLGGAITDSAHVPICVGEILYFGCTNSGATLMLGNGSSPLTDNFRLQYNNSQGLEQSTIIGGPDGGIYVTSSSGATNKSICFDFTNALQYGNDYSTDYTNRTLVDKGYVDGLVLASGATATNGLNKNSAGEIGLGGTLTGDTSINANGYNFSMVCATKISMTGSSMCIGAIYDGWGQKNYIDFGTGAGANSHVIICADTGAGYPASLWMSSNIDGLQYGGCYSTGFTSNLSLVDKGYVDNAIWTSGGTGGGITGATNGLSVVNNAVVLGGALTGSTIICTAGSDFTICDSSGCQRLFICDSNETFIQHPLGGYIAMQSAGPVLAITLSGDTIISCGDDSVNLNSGSAGATNIGVIGTTDIIVLCNSGGACICLDGVGDSISLDTINGAHLRINGANDCVEFITYGGTVDSIIIGTNAAGSARLDLQGNSADYAAICTGSGAYLQVNGAANCLTLNTSTGACVCVDGTNDAVTLVTSSGTYICAGLNNVVLSEISSTNEISIDATSIMLTDTANTNEIGLTSAGIDLNSAVAVNLGTGTGQVYICVTPNTYAGGEDVLLRDTGTGEVKTIPISTLTGATGGGITGATNGLSVNSANQVGLGGTLTGDTNIDTDNYIIDIGNSAGIEINGTATDCISFWSAGGAELCIDGGNNRMRLNTTNVSITLDQTDDFISLGTDKGTGIDIDGDSDAISFSTNAGGSLSFDGGTDCIQLFNTSGSGLDISGTSVCILGTYICLPTTPENGTCSDSVLVWNSTDKQIKIVPYVSGGTGGGLTGSTNGLTDDGNTVCLGGTLNGNTQINVDNGHLIITGGSNFGVNVSFSGVSIGSYIEDTDNTEYIYISDGGIGLFEQDDDIYGSVNISGGYVSLDVNNTGGTQIRWVHVTPDEVDLFASNNSGDYSFLRVCDGAIIVNGANSNGFSGITYNADYSAYFNDRSLVDKAYVDSQSGGGLSEFTISGNSSATGFTVNHALNKQFVIVQVVEAASPYATVYTDVQRTNANCVCVTFDTAPSTGTCYKILISG